MIDSPLFLRETVLRRDRIKDFGRYPFALPSVATLDRLEFRQPARLHVLVGAGSQFIIATHSPILLAYPDATILQCTEEGLRQVAYEETEHFRITRDFLNRYPAMLRTLLAP